MLTVLAPQMVAQLASPATFALLVGLATALVWLAFAPARPRQDVNERLDGYIERDDPIVEREAARSFASRVVAPLLRRVLRFFARFAPRRNAEATRRMLLQAGEPGRLTPLDFAGLRLLGAALLGVAGFLLFNRGQGFSRALVYALAGVGVGYFGPLFWLRSRLNARKHRIQRALPDALDMLTIGVEAGLAFESAMVRVGDKWVNPLTQEFRRAVAEMRVGTPREVALGRMADRCGVADLSTFVAVLVQSTQLGVSIAQVLHAQAAEMRLKRRQRAEELARQAGVKMVFPLVFCVFPALFIVILGPVAPDIMTTLRNFAAGR